jgi:hypothetical protein
MRGSNGGGNHSEDLRFFFTMARGGFSVVSLDGSGRRDSFPHIFFFFKSMGVGTKMGKSWFFSVSVSNPVRCKSSEKLKPLPRSPVLVYATLRKRRRKGSEGSLPTGKRLVLVI